MRIELVFVHNISIAYRLIWYVHGMKFMTIYFDRFIYSGSRLQPYQD
jgi:hypothetical protein